MHKYSHIVRVLIFKLLAHFLNVMTDHCSVILQQTREGRDGRLQTRRQKKLTRSRGRGWTRQMMKVFRRLLKSSTAAKHFTKLTTSLTTSWKDFWILIKIKQKPPRRIRLLVGRRRRRKFQLTTRRSS